MIQTFKVKHYQDLTDLLRQAKKVAQFAIQNRNKLSSKYVKHLSVPSVISNQILRKYGKNKKCKKITRVNLIIPHQNIKSEVGKARIVPLKLILNIKHLPKFKKINQIELSSEYAFIAVTINEPNPFQPQYFVGLDRNISQHVAVLADPSTGKVVKLGKSCLHTRNKYKNLRAKALSNESYKLAKILSKREARKIRDLNHKISRKVVDYCVENRCGLVLENLQGIRKCKSNSKIFNWMQSSWSFYQLEQFIRYKALRDGITVVNVDPAYTSQECSRCGCIGKRTGKKFICTKCKHFDHADANAAFNIAGRHVRSVVDSDTTESLQTPEGVNPDKAQSGNVVESTSLLQPENTI